ncbi:hypothetical protein PsYK624_000640 [Phanerochaete sordida]|uniref:Uncharacterized protein n=1 Tax=Phanerochaete sordida TaxID=48140 RepID=A0A9P3FX53_9APHY|nr:hypothetical protein PsYK624_000640 [Phanerochaete sordida]
MDIPLSEYKVNTIGVSLSCALWGAATMQMFLYFLNYESDHLVLKAAVGALWVLDTTIEILSFVGIFPPMGSPVSFTAGTPPWALIVRTLLTNVVAFSVQLFFLYRIYRLSGQRWAVRVCLVAVALIALWQLVPSCIRCGVW